MVNFLQLSSLDSNLNILKYLGILTMRIALKQKISNHILKVERNFFLEQLIYLTIIGKQACVYQMIHLTLKQTLIVNSKHCYLETNETGRLLMLTLRRKKKTTQRELKISNRIITNKLCYMTTTQEEKIEIIWSFLISSTWLIVLHVCIAYKIQDQISHNLVLKHMEKLKVSNLLKVISLV